MNTKLKLTALKTILRREFIRIIRIWIQTLIPPVIMSILYIIVFGKIIGKNIGEIHDVSYIKYIIPGLIMNSVIINSFNNTVSSFFQTKFHRNIDEMTVSPMPNWLIIIGYVGGGVVRGLLIGLLIMLAALFFADIIPINPLYTLLVVFFSSMLFSTLGFINALVARNFDDISWIPTFVLTPLVYLGGVFYPIEMLPKFWYNLSLFNPILYIVNAFRYGILEISNINPTHSLIIISLLSILAFISAWKMMNLGIGIRK